MDREEGARLPGNDGVLEASPSSSLANEDLSKLAQRFAYEHRDCNPYAAPTINDLFRLLADVRRETIHACAAEARAEGEFRRSDVVSAMTVAYRIEDLLTKGPTT